jgi:glutaredoxin
MNSGSSAKSKFTLELFYFDSCPFCRLVLDFAKEAGIKLTLKNTLTQPQNRDFLMEKTGRGTVPCLFINGQPMHESRDIVKWLKENQNHLDKV